MASCVELDGDNTYVYVHRLDPFQLAASNDQAFLAVDLIVSLVPQPILVTLTNTIIIINNIN